MMVIIMRIRLFRIRYNWSELFLKIIIVYRPWDWVYTWAGWWTCWRQCFVVNVVVYLIKHLQAMRSSTLCRINSVMETYLKFTRQCSVRCRMLLIILTSGFCCSFGPVITKRMSGLSIWELPWLSWIENLIITTFRTVPIDISMLLVIYISNKNIVCVLHAQSYLQQGVFLSF